MTRVSLRLDPTYHPGSQVASEWLLPAGGWLVSIAVNTLAVTGDLSIGSEVLIAVEPANGHHSFSARIVPFYQALAA